MDNFKQCLTNAVKQNWRQTGKEIVDMGSVIIDMAQNHLKIKQDKLKALSVKAFDMSYQYNRVILKYYVPRTIYYYGKNKGCRLSVKKIKSKIENQQYPFKNIIITGHAGAGKSTILKWLFLKSHIHNCNFILLYAKMFTECSTLEEVLAKITDTIPHDKPCIVFFDGLDELSCINGTENELQKFINFFDQKSNPVPSHPDCRFVISTRPEHFGFNKMILQKNLDYTIDNYDIFEVPPLTKKEAFKVCKSIKRLNRYDKKNGLSHFTDKWPAKENPLITEKEYLRFLKKYLDTAADSSILKSPLLCRYAYQIIYSWSLPEYGQDKPAKNGPSSQIQQAVESYIKWEFHDNNRRQTQGGIGKQEFECYKTQVLEYLTELAGMMGVNDFIPKEQWHSLINTMQITFFNQAVCALCEDENNNLCFIHQTFKEFFLACYYARLPSESLINDTVFYHLLNSNSEFSIMYIERLLTGTNDLAQKICNELLNLKDCNMENISEYAKGNLRFLFTPSITFTIEDFLTVFPYGVFLYAGISFDRDTFNQFKQQGLFEIKNIDLLISHQNAPVGKDYITKVKVHLPDIIYMRSHFWVYVGHRLHHIHGYEQIPTGQEDKGYSNPKCTVEHHLINEAVTKSIEFIGIDKKLWCLFDGGFLFLYQIIKENEEPMKILFQQHFADNSDDYITLYAMYLSKSNDESILLQKGHYCRKSDISFDFNAAGFVFQETYPALYQYYHKHYKLNHFFNSKAKHIYSEKYLQESFQRLYTEIHSLMQNTSKPKLKLYLSDDLLAVLYVLGKGELMVNLAYQTLELCKQYKHTKGIMLRNFLIQDDDCFQQCYGEKVLKFVQSYIWI